MNIPIEVQCTSFYEQLKTAKNLDLRDPRRKTPDLHFVLLGVIIALIRNRYGVLSSIHRSIINTNKDLCRCLKIALIKVVSRAQLTLVLKKLMSMFSVILYFLFLALH